MNQLLYSTNRKVKTANCGTDVPGIKPEAYNL